MNKKYTQLFATAILFLLVFNTNTYAQTGFLETFGTSPIPTASNDYGRRTSSNVSSSFEYGTSIANSDNYEKTNIDNGFYAVVAPEFIYSGVLPGFYFWTSPTNGEGRFVEDHTPNDTNGAVLVVNAQTTNTEYYHRDFAFSPDSFYEASFWIYVVNPSTQTTLSIKDPGTNAVLGSVATEGIFAAAAEWKNYKITFKTPSASCGNTTARLVLENVLQGGSGNDYYIDDIEVKKLSADPGNIGFTFTCPTTTAAAEVCTEPVQGETFTVSDGNSKTFNQPATNYGFVFDVFSLDNSFNMKINGTSLSTAELEFQSEDTPAPGINVRFVDGTAYEVGTPKIWEMTGTQDAPLIRVEISPLGEVKMYGSKVSGGPLFPLELFNGNALNNVVWNTNATNQVIIDQNVVGETNMTGRGYGLNIIPCICYDDPNLIGTASDTKHGITLLQRAGVDNGNWPMIRKGAHTALESNTKGFVVTRVATSELTAITNPVDGMMVYDTTVKCLKIYTTDTAIPGNSGWKCFSTPTCP